MSFHLGVSTARLDHQTWLASFWFSIETSRKRVRMYLRLVAGLDGHHFAFHTSAHRTSAIVGGLPFQHAPRPALACATCFGAFLPPEVRFRRVWRLLRRLRRPVRSAQCLLRLLRLFSTFFVRASTMPYFTAFSRNIDAFYTSPPTSPASMSDQHP